MDGYFKLRANSIAMLEPFSHEEFQRQTGLKAHENEAIYARWVNTQINYANYLNLQKMSATLKDLVENLKDPDQTNMDEKFPFNR